MSKSNLISTSLIMFIVLGLVGCEKQTQETDLVEKPELQKLELEEYVGDDSTYITYTPKPEIKPSENKPSEKGEEFVVEYTEGYFSNFRELLVKNIEGNYKSFSGEALIDIYGDTSTNCFDDAIGYIAQGDSYNQVFLFKNLTDSTFIDNITNPITNDPSISNVGYKTFRNKDVTTVVIGADNFIKQIDDLVSSSFKGELK